MWQYIILGVIIVAAGLVVTWQLGCALRGKGSCAGCSRQNNCAARNHSNER